MKGIYSITNVTNGKRYIGRSTDIEKRWQEHKEALLSGNHHSWKLQKAFNDSGRKKSNFRFEVLHEIAEDKEIDRFKIQSVLYTLEWYYMDKFDTLNNGYNVEDTIHELNGNKKYGKSNNKTTQLANLFIKRLKDGSQTLDDVINFCYVGNNARLKSKTSGNGSKKTSVTLKQLLKNIEEFKFETEYVKFYTIERNIEGLKLNAFRKVLIEKGILKNKDFANDDFKEIFKTEVNTSANGEQYYILLCNDKIIKILIDMLTVGYDKYKHITTIKGKR